jgi:hypothetical protein
MRAIRRAAPWFVLAALVAGCGSSNVIPRGRLTKNSEAFCCENGVAVHMTFVTLSPAAAPAPAEAAKGDAGAFPAEYYRDGTFRVVGVDGRGLPPGKYRVAVQAMKDRKDLLDGAYGAQNSPLTCEVKNASEELHLELGEPPSTSAGAATGSPARGRPGERQ